MSSSPPPAPPPEKTAPADDAPRSPFPSWRRALISAAVVSLAVTLVSWLTPKSYAATGVGLVFLASTWFLTIRPEDSDARVWGVSLGGLLDRERISVVRLLKDSGRALLWALCFAAVVFPPFYLGY